MDTEKEKGKENNINIFIWKKFPIEYEKILITLCSKNTKLINNFLKIFPENQLVKNYGYHKDSMNKEDFLNHSIKTIKRINEDKINNSKYTLVLNFDEEYKENEERWSDNFDIINYYEDNNYIFSHGLYKNIPRQVLSLSDFVVFDNLEDINNYIKNLGMNISSFSFDKYILAIYKYNYKHKFFAIEVDYN